MSLGDIVARSDAIYKKFEKYTPKEIAKGPSKGPDAFEDECQFITGQINELTVQGHANNDEPNRALRAAVFAEVRKRKTALLEGNMENLLRILKKAKKLAPEKIRARIDRMEKLRTTIQEIPDGIMGLRLKPTRMGKNSGGSGTAGSPTVTLEANSYSAQYFESTAESSKFAQEWEISKMKQDKHLDSIERGLGTLGEVATAMGEGLKHQDVLIDAVDEKVSSVTKQLQNNNTKLRGLVTQARSPGHFCVDVVLICLLLSIGVFVAKLYIK